MALPPESPIVPLITVVVELLLPLKRVTFPEPVICNESLLYKINALLL